MVTRYRRAVDREGVRTAYMVLASDYDKLAERLAKAEAIIAVASNATRSELAVDNAQLGARLTQEICDNKSRQAEIERLRAECEQQTRDCITAIRVAQDRADEIERLRAFAVCVRAYIQHRTGCGIETGHACNCGLNPLLDSVRHATTVQPSIQLHGHDAETMTEYLRERIRTVQPDAAVCGHKWVNASNFEPGPNEMCVKCGAIREVIGCNECGWDTPTHSPQCSRFAAAHKEIKP